MRTLLLIGCYFIVFSGAAQDVNTQILEVNRAMENTYNEGNVELSLVTTWNVWVVKRYVNIGRT